MNNENEQYSFTFEYPVEYAQPVEKKNDADMKKFVRRAVAICCAVCLLVGIGVGAIVGALVSNPNDRSVSDSTLFSDETESAFPNETGDVSDPPSIGDKKPASSNLLYLTDGDADSLSTVEVVEKVENTVVAISVEVETTVQYYFQTFKQITQASGSGVIVTADGYIVTNNHVVEGGLSYTVTLADGTAYEAKLIGADPETDLAILKIDASGLEYAECGDDTTLKKGESAIVIGNPLGYLDGSVSYGVISAMGRTLDFSDGTTLYNLIQTDAAVSPGNSGGGLFNSKGQLVGVICAKSTASNAEGLGFAIPISTVYNITQDLMAYGYVTGRPALGINTLIVSDYMTAMRYKLEYLGVYVQGYVNETAQKNTELEIGDYIISIDGTDITGMKDIAGILSAHKVGDTLDVRVYREGREMTVKTTLVERNADFN